MIEWQHRSIIRTSVVFNSVLLGIFLKHDGGNGHLVEKSDKR